MSRKREHSLFGRFESWFSQVAKYLGYYTTAVKMAQLVPILVGLAVVLFSPTAWLSATLRNWAYAAMAAGSLAGVIGLAALVSRGWDRREQAYGMLGVLLVAGGMLRVHLATIDISFVERWTVLRPLQDFYLGSDFGEVTFNVVAAVLFSVMLFAATIGLPLFVKWRGRGATTRQGASPDLDTATRVREAMDLVSSEFATLYQRVGDLQEENRELRERLAEREREIDAARRPADVGRTDSSSG